MTKKHLNKHLEHSRSSSDNKVQHNTTTTTITTNNSNNKHDKAWENNKYNDNYKNDN